MQDDELAILSVPTPTGKSTLNVPPSNTEFVYAVGRALSFWPVINGNDATWLEEELSKLYANTVDENLTFRGKLVDIDHEVGKGSKSLIIGTTIREKYIPGVGIDVLNQLDRRCLAEYDIKPTDFGRDGEYSKQSVEINVDRSLSKYIVMINPHSTRLEDQKVYSAEEAAAMGIRRGVLVDGKYRVVEACVPRRVRGIAMLGNPADTTAQVYDIAAAQDEPYGDVEYADPGFQEDKKKRYPLDTPEHVRAAAAYFGAAKNRDEYTAEQRAHIQDLIDAAKKRHNIGDEDASVKTPPSDTYEDSSALDNAYANTSPMSVSNDDCDGLDDGAFAVVQGGDERAAAGTKPSIRVRSHPLYESNKHHYAGIPHKGLIKAALVGIGPDKDGKRPYPQAVHSEALRRVRNAHQQLTGDYSMALTPEEIAKLTDPLQADIAKLHQQIADEKATLSDRDKLHADALALKDTEIANLTAKVAEFEAKANEQAALVVANERLAELSKIDGFTVKDEEKAALLEALAKETPDQFKNRVLGEENAALKSKLAAAGTVTDTSKKDALHEEHAGLRALSGAPVKIAAESAHAALFA